MYDVASRIVRITMKVTVVIVTTTQQKPAGMEVKPEPWSTSMKQQKLERGHVDFGNDEILKPGKDEPADGDEEDEKEEFLEAVLQGVSNRLEARGMPRNGPHH